MIPYYTLIFLPILFSFLRFKDQSLEKKNRNVMFLFFFIFLLMLMFRDVIIGRDLPRYMVLYNNYAGMNWQKALAADIEPLYIILSKLIGDYMGNFQWFIIITGAITALPMLYTYSKTSEDPVLSISLFLIMPTFVMTFSGVRQAIAISIGILAYEATKRKKLIPFIVFVALAIGFHRSAFVLAFMYPLYHARITRRWLYAVIPTMGVIYIFNRPIFAFLNSFISEFYEGEIKETGAFMMLFLFIIFAVYSFVVVEDSSLDNETIGLRNFLLLAVILQMFAPLHSLAMRMNYYYIIFIPLLLPKIIKRCSPQWEKIVFVSRYVMVIYFLFYFFDHAPSGNILDTFPYKFFWEG